MISMCDDKIITIFVGILRITVDIPALHLVGDRLVPGPPGGALDVLIRWGHLTITIIIVTIVLITIIVITLT